MFFQWFVDPEGGKVSSLKRRVRSQLARGEMKNCTPLWREAHFEVKMYKTPQRRTTFGSWDVEKVQARSTFRSQNVQNTPGSDHFWKLRCRKSARRCGAKHISKSKVQKTEGYGALLGVQMSFHGFCSTEHINSCAPMIQALPDPPQKILWNRRWKQKLRQRLSASELQQAHKKATLRT